MREVGDEVGAPPATVSQVEKGQRALKEPKISSWARALKVSERDLHELWLLSQGLVPRKGRQEPVFYERRGALGAEPLRAGLPPSLEDGPDLEPVFRLADRIATVLRRVLPGVGITVTAEDFEPPHIGPDDSFLTPEERIENEAAWEAYLPLPLIEFVWGATPGARELSEQRFAAVRVPLLQEVTPIVRRSSGLSAAGLEDLIRALSAPERERVRGYIDAVVESRVK